MKSVIYSLIFLCAVSASGAESVRVVASVLRVDEYGPPMKPGVYINFVVHTPAEFRGLPITMFTSGVSRRVRRAEFPLGGVFALQLPDTAVVALKKAKVDEEHIQSTIDEGAKPEMISQLVTPAQVDLAELATKPVAVEIR